MTEQTDYAPVPELTLGWRIQMALAQAGLKHADLIERFEVSRGTVSRWCRDAEPRPKKFILNEIAVMCDVSARWLIDGKAPNGDGPGGDGGGLISGPTSWFDTEALPRPQVRNTSSSAA